MSIGVSAALFAAGAVALACGPRSAPPAPAPTTSLALRIVDSSHAAQALAAVRVRLIGPQPRQDTVACSDSTREAVLWVPSVRPGRYLLALRRIGFEGRTVLIDVAEHQRDTITVGLRPATGDLVERVVTSPSLPRCTARR